MVTSVSNLGRSGLYDWVIQRLTAVILAGYTIYLLLVFATNPDLDYQRWLAIFATFPMRFFTLLAILSLCAHGWIGMWTISTDYLTQDMLGKQATLVRFLIQTLCALITLAYLVWGVQVLWGN